VAAGALAKEFLGAVGASVHSHVLQIGSVAAPERDDLEAGDFEGVDESPVRCLDAAASEAMVAEIDRLRKANESLGGVFEVRAFGLVPGLGSHTSWDGRLDGRLAQAVVSIQAVKGCGIGDGFDLAGRSMTMSLNGGAADCGAISSTNAGLVTFRPTAGTPLSRFFSPM